MKRILSAVALGAAVMVTGACTGGPSEPAATGGGQPEQTPGTLELTAGQLVEQLAQRVPEAAPSVVFTAETDPNDLLGRPNGYTSRASFTDSRVEPESVEGLEQGAVDFGGTVEVFASQEAARRRVDFIQSTFAEAPILGTEYDYVRGGVLLRVIGTLTPDQAAAYEAALGEIES